MDIIESVNNASQKAKIIMIQMLDIFNDHML